MIDIIDSIFLLVATVPQRGICVSIRKHSSMEVTLDDVVCEWFDNDKLVDVVMSPFRSCQ